MKTYKLPASLASMIVNSDNSGLTDEEVQEFEQFCENEGIDSGDLTLPNMEQEPYLTHNNDMNNIGGNVLDFLHYTQSEIELLRDGQKALKDLVSPIGITLDFQVWPLLCKITTSDVVITTSDYNTHSDVSELLAEVASILEGENLPKDENGNVYVAYQTDVWYSNNDRSMIGIFSSEIQAVLSAMRYTGEILSEDSGGYKSIREEFDCGVFITQYKIDEVEG